jgi:hypothetical protein
MRTVRLVARFVDDLRVVVVAIDRQGRDRVGAVKLMTGDTRTLVARASSRSRPTDQATGRVNRGRVQRLGLSLRLLGRGGPGRGERLGPRWTRPATTSRARSAPSAGAGVGARAGAGGGASAGARAGGGTRAGGGGGGGGGPPAVAWVRAVGGVRSVAGRGAEGRGCHLTWSVRCGGAGGSGRHGTGPRRTGRHGRRGRRGPLGAGPPATSGSGGPRSGAGKGGAGRGGAGSRGRSRGGGA